MITSESKFSGRRAPGGPSLLHYSAGVRKIIVGNLCSELMSTRRAGARAAGPTTRLKCGRDHAGMRSRPLASYIPLLITGILSG